MVDEEWGWGLVGMGLMASPRAKALGNGEAEPLAQRFEIRFFGVVVRFA